jgi:hypothetical protein
VEMWPIFGLIAMALIISGLVSASLLAMRADEMRDGGHGGHETVP